MELPQYEGLPPLRHFTHNGEDGHASTLTFDDSLSPALRTVSSVVFRISKDTRAPKGLCESLRLRDGLAEEPLCNANGDRFFRTDKTAIRLSQKFELLGTDLVQSQSKLSAMDNPQRFDVFESFEEFKRARLVFYANQMHFVRANGGSPAGATEFHCFQPFVRRLSNDLALFAYLPLGQHPHAFIIASEQSTGHSKTLVIDVGLGNGSCHLNHWSFFVGLNEEFTDGAFSDDGEASNFAGASLYLTNLCKLADGTLHFFYAEESFCLPRAVYCLCAECYCETSMSQLCGGHYCFASDSFDALNPAAYKIAMDREREKNERLQEVVRDYHLLGNLKISSEELFEKAPAVISSSTAFRFSDTFVVRVNGYVFDVKVDFGKIVDLFESIITEPRDAIAFSPLFGKACSFLYVKKDGLLVLQDDIFGNGERKVYGRIVPKAAENVKLFLPLGETVYCYWTIGRKHYMTNLENFLAKGILEPAKEEKP